MLGRYADPPLHSHLRLPLHFSGTIGSGEACCSGDPRADRSQRRSLCCAKRQGAASIRRGVGRSDRTKTLDKDSFPALVRSHSLWSDRVYALQVDYVHGGTNRHIDNYLLAWQKVRIGYEKRDHSAHQGDAA